MNVQTVVRPHPSRLVKLALVGVGFAPPAMPGGTGSGAALQTHTHPQTIAASVWTVPHNLNRFPSVTTTDHLGNVIHGDVFYVDSNIVRITHGSALTGFAYFN